MLSCEVQKLLVRDLEFIDIESFNGHRDLGRLGFKHPSHSGTGRGVF